PSLAAIPILRTYVMHNQTRAARVPGRERPASPGQLAADTDRLLARLACVLGPVSLALAGWQGQWGATLMVGLPAVAFVLVQVYLFRGTRLGRVSVAVGLAALATALLHQSSGMAEVRVGAILLVALLLYYRDWLPIVVAGVTLAALHLASVPMQRAGLPLSLFPAGGGSGIVLAHLACLLAATVVLAVMAARMRRQLLCLGSEPRRLAALATGLAAGQPLPAQVAAEQFPPGSVADALATMSGQLVERLAHDREADREHLRIRAALDSVTTNVMIADAERTIAYANRSLMETLRQAAANLRRDLRHFDVAGLIGGSIDAFHRNPAHQSRLLAGLKGTHTAQIQVGGHAMRLTVNQVRDGDGQLVGYVVEWLDRTEEVRIEQEVARVVEAAAAGDLSGRLELDGKRNFTLSLSHSLNALLDNFARSAARLSEVLQALARGDLTVRMEGEFHGVFARMR